MTPSGGDKERTGGNNNSNAKKVPNVHARLKPPHYEILEAIYVLAFAIEVPSTADIQRHITDGKVKHAGGALRNKLNFLEKLGCVERTRVSSRLTTWELTTKGQAIVDDYISDINLASEADKSSQSRSGQGEWDGGQPSGHDHQVPSKSKLSTPVRFKDRWIPFEDEQVSDHEIWDRLHDLRIKIQYIRTPGKKLLQQGFHLQTDLGWDRYSKTERDMLIVITSKNIILRPQYDIWGRDPYDVLLEAEQELKDFLRYLKEEYGIIPIRISIYDNKGMEIIHMHHGMKHQEPLATALAKYGLLEDCHRIRHKYKHVEADASIYRDPVTGKRKREVELDFKHKEAAADDFDEWSQFVQSFPSAENAINFADSFVQGKYGWGDWPHMPERIRKNARGVTDIKDEIQGLTEGVYDLTQIQAEGHEIQRKFYEDHRLAMTGNMTLIQNVNNTVDEKLKDIKQEIKSTKKKGIWTRIKEALFGE